MPAPQPNPARQTPVRPTRVIAIDGPAASGKSAVGTGVARALGFRFFDTGAMYRAATWLCLERGISPEDEEAVATLVEDAEFAISEALDTPEPTQIRVAGVDATPHLRDHEVELNVSLVSRIPRVRNALVRIQRDLAAPGGVVMAGRDIGTVVLPDADLKIYLDASAEVRAERRVSQATHAGLDVDEAALPAELARRDRIDSTREESPLTAASDAMIIHTDEMSIDAVINRILELAR